MKFERSDDTGNKLIDTLGQELFSASDCYRTFIDCKKIITEEAGRFIEVRTYLAYSNMLRSLYEYYVGIFKLNDGNTKSLSPPELDARMNNAALRLVNFYRLTESLLNPIYPEKVPKNFGRDFRVIRNRISHSDYRRMKPVNEKDEISLADFYLKYHFYINQMIQHPQFSWDGEEYRDYKWEPVDEFSQVVRKYA